MKRRILTLLFMILTTIVLIYGYIQYYDPPTPKDADTFLFEYQHDIDVVVNYLKTINSDDAYIDRYGTTVFYDFEYHDIASTEVQSSIRRLSRAGCERISIQNSDNTVFFEIWERTKGNVSCGIACTLDGLGFPKVEVQTSCEPISDGWFYYYADYEEYRRSPSKYDEMWAAETVYTS